MTHSTHYLLVGLDGKVDWVDGRMCCLPPGSDKLLVLDVGVDPRCPREVARLSLSNSVFGPPTNLAVTPDQRLALVADSMEWRREGDNWKPSAGRCLHVLNMTTTPPRVQQTLAIGLQPSGLAINRSGTLSLVANRAGCSVSVLKISGDEVVHVRDIDLGSPAAAVSFSADGSRAYVAKMDQHRLAVLHINGTQVSYDPSEDLVTGLVPFNLAITPDGRFGLTVDMGHPNASDGHIDTVSVFDLSCVPPRCIDRITVGDGPEGMAMSPDGRHAAVAIVQGSNEPRDRWYHQSRGCVVLLAIEGEGVRLCDRLYVGALPEGLAFSPDGGTLYVGNYLAQELQLLAVGDGRLSDTGLRVALGGRPASMRAQSF